MDCFGFQILGISGISRIRNLLRPTSLTLIDNAFIPSIQKIPKIPFKEQFIRP